MKTFSVLLLAVSLGVGILEGLVRLLNHVDPIYDLEMTRYALEVKTPSPDPQIGFVHRPGARAQLMGVDVQINRSGLRELMDHTEKRVAQKKRVLLLGDSLTFGWGVPQERTFARLVEDEETEVLNFGHGNFNASQIAAHFEAQGPRWNPHLVVYNYFLNDAEAPPEDGYQAPGPLAQSLLAALVWSRVRILFPGLLGAQNDYRTYYKQLYRERGWDLTQAAIVRLKQSVQASGGKLVVALLPELHDPENYPFTQEHALVTAFLEREGIPSVDLLKNLQGLANPQSLWVAEDDAHPNAEGHVRIASGLKPFIRAHLK